jgi:hypothetical protein
VWTGGEIYVDRDAQFKKALYPPFGKVIKLSSVFKASLEGMILAAKYGQNTKDIIYLNNLILGGELVVGPKNKGVVYSFNETYSFKHASIKSIEKAVYTITKFKS